MLGCVVMSRIESLGVYQNPSQIHQKKHKNVSFATSESNSPPKEENKGGSPIKKATNILGVVLCVGSIGAIVLSGKLKPKAVKLFEKQSKEAKKATDAIDNLRDKVTVDKSGLNTNFKMGLWFDKVSSQSKELFNNIIYGVGTVVVMPLVILFAPFGKKKSTPEERWATVMRQPMSFVTMFSMQLTVEKLFKDIVPKFIKKNSFEKNIGPDKEHRKFENIQFNEAEYRPHLDEQLEKIGGFSKDRIKDLHKANNMEAFKNEIINCCSKEKAALLLPKFEKFKAIKGKGDLLSQSIIILGNVFFSVPVGCTTLNLLYGKSMKAMNASKEAKIAKQNSEKGGQV